MNSFFVSSWGKSSKGFCCIIVIRTFIKGNKLLNVQVCTYFYRYKVFIISSKGSCKIQALFQLHFQSKYFLSTTNLWMTSQMKNGISRSDRECHLRAKLYHSFLFYGPETWTEKIRKVCRENI